jgi:tetratricopeptide (TPR) repeat protein
MFTELRRDPEKPLEESLPLYNLQARNLLNTGKNKKAVELLEQIIDIEGTTLAPDHPNRLYSQRVLAGAYQANGQVKDAVKLLEQVIEIKEMTLAETHPDRLASQHELARAYQANGQVEGAVKLLERVVEIHKMTLAETHPSRTGR